jgi:hypothetical protein
MGRSATVTEEEERARGGCPCEPAHHLVEGRRQFEVQVACRDAGQGGEVEGVRRDPAYDVGDGRRQGALLDARDRHEQRDHREQEEVVEHEDQRDGRAGGGSDRREHERRAHVADVRVRPRHALHHRLGHVAPRVPQPGPEREREGDRRAQGRREHVRPVEELLERLVGDEPVEEAGQRRVDKEELHPREAGFRPPHGLAAEETERDETEERGEQVEQADEIGHPAYRRGEAAASRSLSEAPQRRRCGLGGLQSCRAWFETACCAGLLNEGVVGWRPQPKPGLLVPLHRSPHGEERPKGASRTTQRPVWSASGADPKGRMERALSCEAG